MTAAQILQSTVVLASEAEHEVNHVLSYGIGLLVLVIMLGLLAALLGFGNGREHS
ncbi:hypothetical protein [Nocardioides salarius]|jgi:hypothetical protein|uniref:Uncharacterized protein n=1 Tax=Nocardioides salarius TaxID=374513 RepID=A0ABS2MFE0_9ACTN|nr:hypothetical protein [Nocardioides salarius]MBM7509908.1 hypothetical protein [Nocardioides salarius]